MTAHVHTYTDLGGVQRVATTFPEDCDHHRLHPMTEAQETALKALCERYGVDYDPEHYKPTLDLPKTWVAGWVGGPAVRKLYVGCDPEGRISS